MKGQMPEKKQKHLKSRLMDVTRFQKNTKTSKKKSLGKEISNCLRGREYIYNYENQKKRLKNDEGKLTKPSKAT